MQHTVLIGIYNALLHVGVAISCLQLLFSLFSFLHVPWAVPAHIRLPHTQYKSPPHATLCYSSPHTAYTHVMAKSFFTLGMAVLAMAACKQKTNDAPEVLPEVPVVKATRIDTTVQTGYVANIKAIRNTEIRSRVHGFLEKVLVDEGKLVRAGQPLFQLSTGELRIEVAKAEAALASALAEAKTAELELERVGGLVDKKVITKTEKELAAAKMEMAQARISAARASLEEAQLKLSYATIKAPFTGVVNRIPLRLGSLIEEGTLLTTLSDVQQVFAYFNVSENDYLRLSSSRSDTDMVNEEVDLELSDGNMFSNKGRVETMEGEFDESTGAIAFRARFPNPNAVLKHGATGKIWITAREEGALVIPQKAVFEIQDRYFVFLVDGAGMLRQKSFVPKSRLGQNYIVAEGLKEGDIMVYEGAQNLRDGRKVKPRLVPNEGMATAAQ